MSDKILAALNVKNEAQALLSIEVMNTFLANVKEVTGRDTFDASVALMREVFDFAAAVEKETGKSRAESFGVVLAWKSAFGELPGAKAKASDLEDKLDTQALEDLLAKGLETVRAGCNEHAGKLTPAMATYWRDKRDSSGKRDVEGLKGFLSVAQRHVAFTEIAAPKSPAMAATDVNGQKYEDLKPAALASMKKSDRVLFDALRSDWINRGQPPGRLLTALDKQH